MRRLFAALPLLTVAAGAPLATPAPASAASCTQEYYVCLNDQVYSETGFKAELEAIECGLEFFGCLARKV